jgi:hypothetical protein
MSRRQRGYSRGEYRGGGFRGGNADGYQEAEDDKDHKKNGRFFTSLFIPDLIGWQPL